MDHTVAVQAVLIGIGQPEELTAFLAADVDFSNGVLQFQVGAEHLVPGELGPHVLAVGVIPVLARHVGVLPDPGRSAEQQAGLHHAERADLLFDGQLLRGVEGEQVPHLGAQKHLGAAALKGVGELEGQAEQRGRLGVGLVVEIIDLLIRQIEAQHLGHHVALDAQVAKPRLDVPAEPGLLGDRVESQRRGAGDDHGKG